MIEKSQLVDIYLDGFEDSRSFAEWFISEAIEENTFLLSENDKPISAGYIVEKPAFLFGKEIRLPYLSALSTKKEFRGQGKIASVIKSAFVKMYHRGCAFTVLNPFNDAYYKRFGFADISFCKKSEVLGGKSYNIKKIASIESSLSKKVQNYKVLESNEDIKALCKIEANNARGFDNYLIKGENEIKKLIECFASDGIDCNLICDKNEPIAFYFASSNKIEYYAEIRPNILCNIENLKGMIYEDYYSGRQAYIQARIINAENALLDYPYDKGINGVFEFKITDSFFISNNKSIIIEIINGKARRSKSKEAEQFSLDISTLCSQMFLGGSIFKANRTLFKDKY